MRGLSAGSQPQPGQRFERLGRTSEFTWITQSGQLPNRKPRRSMPRSKSHRGLEGPQGTLFGAGAEAGVIRTSRTNRSSTWTEANVKAATE